MSRLSLANKLLTEPLSASEEIPGVRLVCDEVRGGNHRVNDPIELPGLLGWVYSNPLEPAVFGGDVHYFSACSQGAISRFVLADVSGHGQIVSSFSSRLHELIRKYINTWDQSALMRDLNDDLERNREGDLYATAAVFGYNRFTGELIFTRAGHPSPLWYRSDLMAWEWLDASSSFVKSIEGLPLGLISGTNYVQRAVRLAPGDMLVIYTDGISDARDEAGESLGSEGLINIVRNLPTETPVAAADRLLSALRAFRGDSNRDDDESFLIVQRTEMRARKETLAG